ncbi:thioredoxin-like protein [Lepidopterella palustris CBS 459.81]|uniref:Thioredoxin-like protein n=1 Tax=Lepidopterella palustris CBS 459.81 TaxID=1314670 RepID=A0A8E2JBV7_9PEZI|nr:thioredoxin-like protein [Lepidopterella palustris CBS 459.81]
MATNGTPPKITLYTNHGCPWAHRAHITLRQLGLPYEEVIIDLGKPREAWYLDINPRGLVPSIKYSNGVIHDEIITESAIVSQFLADSHPSSFLPASNESPTAALTRARINFFVDTWFTKAGSYWFKILTKDDGEEKDALVKEFLGIVEKEIEPLLKDAGPFFGGSKTLTFAEALTAPFILRIYALSNKGRFLPEEIQTGLDKLPNFSKWAAATIAHDSVTYIWDEEAILKSTVNRIEKLKAQAK